MFILEEVIISKEKEMQITMRMTKVLQHKNIQIRMHPKMT